MNSLDKQYTELLQTIIDFGATKKDRTGTGTKSIFGYTIRHNMREGFPLLTTKKMAWKQVVSELLWFLRGETNIRPLVLEKNYIWVGDAYKNYCKHASQNDAKWNKWMRDNGDGTLSMFTEKEFIEKIRDDIEFAEKWGELGPIYGKQWRSWATMQGMKVEGGDGVPYVLGWKLKQDNEGNSTHDSVQIDQIANSINLLKTDPDSRRNKVSAWNVGEIDQMVLPPCHTDFQFYTRELSRQERYKIWFSNNYETGMEYNEKITPDYENSYYVPTPKRAISLLWNQRSVDTFLGLPFNIASYGLLLEIVARISNMVPDQLIGMLGDTHLYLNHLEQTKEQIGRELTLEERIELASKDPVFDPGDFGIGDQVTDESCHEVCDSYNVPKRTREPFALPKLVSGKNDEFFKSLREDLSLLSQLETSDFTLENYQAHPAIKADLSN